ncbi:hypothetical protein [Flavobacterium haoranii]|uniref:Outer membrane protein beta-barrel domain-containing protein n=1 Tax=Flavobacterium haoranii TaxID=683124 RepID=A0A1M6EY03_9FLAO|nr:hypothetical protein [Flavobacterium haoranii]SHI90261.1 hypothetical protein SAMN05444337_1072 [Flavobacterium haoranii]
MKESKNIERLFQEKFKDFEAIPPSESWDFIEARLNEKKKKKRVIPFWFKTSGIAAVFVIGLGFLINYYSGNDTTISIEDAIVNEEVNSSKENQLEQNTNQKFKNEEDVIQKHIRSNEVVTESKERQNNTNNSSKSIELNKEKIEDSNDNGSFVNNKSNNTKKDKKYNDFDLDGEQNVLVQNKRKIKKSSSNIKNETSIINSTKNKSELFISNEVENNVVDNNSTTKSNNQNSLLGNSVADVINANNEKLDNLSKNLVDNSQNNNDVNEAINISIIDSTFKNNSNLVENNSLQNDSIQVVVNEELNELEKLLKEKEEGKDADEKEKEEKVSKWAVSTNASPIYFNSISEGSPIDQSLATNTKKSNLTMSYGVGLQYQLSSKLALKAGINNLNLSYETQNVYYETALVSTSGFNQNIDENANARNIHIYGEKPVISPTTLFSDVDTQSFDVAHSGNLRQDIRYFEIPLELSYKLVDKKFGIDLVGGFSTFLLNGNSIWLLDEGMEMEIGKANNLNNTNFSSNLGFGLNYKFLKNFRAEIQPMFKYQFNTFSENSGDFKPYFIGVYSGLSYRF